LNIAASRKGKAAAIPVLATSMPSA
jgi:hypothetical protein